MQGIMALALQTSLDLRGGEMHSLSREDLLARYRQYRDIRTEIQTATLENIPHSSFLKQAKRLGISDGKVLFTDDQVELTLAFDLSLYTSKHGRTRVIDRYARAHAEDLSPQFRQVLTALCASRFSLFEVVERHELAGVVLEDYMRDDEVWLLDENFETSAKPGMIFASRVAPIEDFVITCGAIVPIDAETFEELADYLLNDLSTKELAELADDPRFAESTFQLAIELGLTSLVAYR
jgi:hypothetical protein